MLDPEMIEQLATFFSLVEMFLTELGVWSLLGICIAAILVVRLGIALMSMIRA